MISHEYKCIYVHIPKTGGTSIEKKLGWFEELKSGVQDHRGIVNIRDTMVHELFQAYFKFTIVRNPWARVYSWYRNILRDDLTLEYYKMSRDSPLIEYTCNHMEGDGVVIPQLQYIRDESNEILVDYVGRFDRLEAEFTHVCKILKISDPTLPRLLIGGNPHYAKAYDNESRERVARRYAEEIEYFGFKYGEGL